MRISEKMKSMAQCLTMMMIAAGCLCGRGAESVSAPDAKTRAAPPVQTGSLNVKDFGALGDGKHDDTDAVQRCLLEAGSSKYPVIFGGHVPAPEVYFPEGVYIVSRTLLVPPCGGNREGLSFINLRGDRAVIRQTNPSHDIFYFRLAYRNLIEGLTFEGGRRQLKIWTKNRDKAHIIIRDCVFRGSSDFAVDDQLRVNGEILRPDWSSHIMEPYHDLSDGAGLPLLSARDENQWRVCGYVSTGMRISRCVFKRCMGALSIWDDWALVDNCKIETNPDMSGPAILDGGTLILENIEGIGHVNPKKDQWWITLDSRRTMYPGFGNASVDLRNVRLKTDSDTGWCVIRNEAQFKHGCLTAIHASDCVFQAAAPGGPAVVHLMEIPNQIVVRDCREMSGKDAALISWGQSFPESYFKTADENSLAFLFAGNNGLSVKLPGCVSPFLSKPHTSPVMEKFKEPDGMPSLESARARIVKSLNVARLGAKGDGVSDDSPAFQRAMDAAASESGLVEIIVPNGVYKLDQTVRLPTDVVIRGAGYTGITSSDGKKHPVFSRSGAGIAVIQNLNFFLCESAVCSSARAGDEHCVLIDNCSFNRLHDIPVRCLTGDGVAAEKNKGVLKISDCTFEYTRMFLHNLSYALCENCWVSGDSDMKDSGAVVNKGTTHIKTLLVVPQISRLYRSRGKDKSTTEGTDMRWVNNFCNILIDRCRFGNEDGGLPVIVNLSPGGVISVRDSWLCMRKKTPGNPARNSFVSFDEIPEFAEIIGNRGYPAAAMLSVPNGSLEKLGGHFFQSANALPSTVEEKKQSAP
jgi:hypothetical protein